MGGTVKRCSGTCGETMSGASFSRNNSEKDGLHPLCKRCAREYQKQLRRSDPRWWLLSAAKKRARRLGLPFDLAKNDLSIPERCPVLDIRLEVGDGVLHAASPTLDRTEPSRGYVKGNVVVMSHRANTLKSNATAEELRQVLAYLTGLHTG